MPPRYGQTGRATPRSDCWEPLRRERRVVDRVAPTMITRGLPDLPPIGRADEPRYPTPLIRPGVSSARVVVERRCEGQAYDGAFG